jgi:hypothetical protein
MSSPQFPLSFNFGVSKPAFNGSKASTLSFHLDDALIKR